MPTYDEISERFTSNPYKNTSGAHYLKALFYEVARDEDKQYVLYTLKPYDIELNGKVIVSISKKYIELNDPTEYTLATNYFDSWVHWKKIRECNWFKPIYDEMKEELEVKIRSDALVKLRNSMKDPKNTVQVGKYLLDKGWVDKTDMRGRPNKDKIKHEAEKLMKEKDDISEDYSRIKDAQGVKDTEWGRIVSIADRV